MMVRPRVWLTETLTICCQAVAPHAAHVLAHAVEDDDSVVGRVAGDRQDRGDHVQREVVPEEGQERQRHQQVVDGRDDGADGEAELEPDGDVDQDAAEREHGREHAPAASTARRHSGRRSRCRPPRTSRDSLVFKRLAATRRRVLLRLPPASAPTLGTRIITCWTPDRRTAA